MQSYARGETEPALIEETIGANFDRTVTGKIRKVQMREESARELGLA